jgi:hypothetical protein
MQDTVDEALAPPRTLPLIIQAQSPAICKAASPVWVCSRGLDGLNLAGSARARRRA